VDLGHRDVMTAFNASPLQRARLLDLPKSWWPQKSASHWPSSALDEEQVGERIPGTPSSFC
jgi:hypothetical protein